jgi:hypothetical protein
MGSLPRFSKEPRFLAEQNERIRRERAAFNPKFLIVFLFTTPDKGGGIGPDDRKWDHARRSACRYLYFSVKGV